MRLVVAVCAIALTAQFTGCTESGPSKHSQAVFEAMLQDPVTDRGFLSGLVDVTQYRQIGPCQGDSGFGPAVIVSGRSEVPPVDLVTALRERMGRVQWSFDGDDSIDGSPSAQYSKILSSERVIAEVRTDIPGDPLSLVIWPPDLDADC